MPKRSPASGDGFERRKLLAGHHRVGFGAIGDAVRQRPDGIEGSAQGERACCRHALAARLEADDAAERRRDAHRASGVAADGDLGHAVADRDRRAGRRAAGHARAIARIARRAEMRIGADGAERELGHVGLGDDHRAGRAQPAHDGSVGRGRRSLVGEDLRARPRRLAGDVEQILDADDRSVERAERYAVFGARIRCVRRRARGAGIDRQAALRRPPRSDRRCGRAPVQAGRGRREVSCQFPDRCFCGGKTTRKVALRGPIKSVIPGPREARSPEFKPPVSQNYLWRPSCNFCGYGFRRSALWAAPE